MALVSIAVGGALGSWAFRAGNAVGSSWNRETRRRQEEKEREERRRKAYNARRREQYAKRKAQASREEEAARKAESQGGVLVMAHGQIDQVALDSVKKGKRKPRAKSAVPKVRVPYFAEPVEQDPIAVALMQRLGLKRLEELNFVRAWAIKHIRSNPDHARPATALAFGWDDFHALINMKVLAGLSEEDARAEALDFARVSDPQTLAKLLKVKNYGEFEVEIVEILFPFNPGQWGLKGS